VAHIRKITLAGGGVRWQARVSTFDGDKRHYEAHNFRRRSDAEAWVRDQGSLIERRQTGSGQASVAAYVERWLTYLEGRATLERKTVVEYRRHLARLLAIVGRIRLDRLDAEDLDRAYVVLLARGGKHGKPLAPRTVLHVHRIIHTALTRAVKWRLVPFNAASEAEAPSAGRSPASAPSPDQLRAYLAAAEETPWRTLILVAVATGLRRGELAALRWSDLDLDTQTLTVRQTMWEVAGEFGIKQRAKTDSSLRCLALPDFLVAELRSHKAQQTEARLALGGYWRADLDLVFCASGGEPYPPSALTRAASTIARAAGLPSAVAPLHGLRHGHATAMMAEGVPLKIASARLGHSTTRITADLYQHATQELDRAAADAIQRVILPLVRKGP
jgi:integrase